MNQVRYDAGEMGGICVGVYLEAYIYVGKREAGAYTGCELHAPGHILKGSCAA